MIAKELRVHEVDLQELLDQVRIVIREELEAALRKNYAEQLLSATAARKCFVPEISRGTFYNYVEEGLIPFILLRGKRHYKLSDIIRAGEQIKRYSPGKDKLRAA